MVLKSQKCGMHFYSEPLSQSVVEPLCPTMTSASPLR